VPASQTAQHRQTRVYDVAGRDRTSIRDGAGLVEHEIAVFQDVKDPVAATDTVLLSAKASQAKPNRGEKLL